jgi:hypothetical protein
MAEAEESPGIEAWEPWTPNEVAAVLKGCDAPWCVVGGWAIDLFLGHTSRPHADIEIAVPRISFPNIRKYLLGYDLYVVGGGVRDKLQDGIFPADKHQCWILDCSDRKWRLDVMLEPGDRQTWVYRRNSRITALRDEFVLRDRQGIPFLAPQAVLLFKAAARRKDNDDFENVVPHLSHGQRNWLRSALSVHPTNSWTQKLG